MLSSGCLLLAAIYPLRLNHGVVVGDSAFLVRGPAVDQHIRFRPLRLSVACGEGSDRPSALHRASGAAEHNRIAVSHAQARCVGLIHQNVVAPRAIQGVYMSEGHAIDLLPPPSRESQQTTIL